MKVAVAAETEAGEPRVAATPETVKKMIALGAEVAVEPGAGIKSGIPDADFGETVAAIIVAKPGQTLTEASIINALKREIAHFKVPKRVYFASELPRNAMGKVQKAALRQKLAE